MANFTSMRIGLALSGGGALGAAHIGVLDVLANEGVRPDCIGGTSSGALIGLLLAAGGVPMLNAFLDDLRERKVIDTVGALILKTADGIFAEMRRALEEQVGDVTFAELPTPFFCTATDLMTGEMVLLEEGPVVEAVLASCAYPGVFPIQRVGGRHLIDGGVTRNLPADLVRARGVDVLIGSSLYCLSPLTPQQQHGRLSRFAVVARALEIIERDRVRDQLALCDVCFTPPVETYKWYDLDHVTRLREVGRVYAATRLDAVRAALAGAPSPA